MAGADKGGDIMTPKMNLSLSDPKAVAEAGERIYRDRYKKNLEETHLGEFVAIEVRTEQAYLGETPEDALNKGRTQSPNGIFHLMKVGSPGAFRVGYASPTPDWLFQ